MNNAPCPGQCQAELTTGQACRSGECVKTTTPQMKALFDRMKDLAKDVVFVTSSTQGKSIAVESEIITGLQENPKCSGNFTILPVKSRPKSNDPKQYLNLGFDNIDLSLGAVVK